MIEYYIEHSKPNKKITEIPFFPYKPTLKEAVQLTKIYVRYQAEIRNTSYMEFSYQSWQLQSGDTFRLKMRKKEK